MNKHTTETYPIGVTYASGTYIDKKGNSQVLDIPLIDEHEFTVYIPGETSLHFMCIPQYLRELIAGHLLSEGRISEISDLLEYSFNVDCTCAEVRLRHAQHPNELPTNLHISDVDLSLIFSAVRKLHEGFDSYKTTKSTHSCQLWFHGQLIRVFEDIGRHNAIDKAIGYSYLQGYDPQACFLFTSCRLPTDLVKKVIRSRFPVLASKSMPTRQSVELAQQYGLKLICSAKPDSLILYQ